MNDYVRTIKWYQDQCHEAMGGLLIKELDGGVVYDEWEEMTEQEMERRITQWQENMMLQ